MANSDTAFGSGFDRGWKSKDGIAVIWHEPKFNQIVIDTYNHSAESASLSPDEARIAAAALLAFAEEAEDRERAVLAASAVGRGASGETPPSPAPDLADQPQGDFKECL